MHLIVLLLQAVSRIRKRNVVNKPDTPVGNLATNGLVFDVNLFKRPKEVNIY